LLAQQQNASSKMAWFDGIAEDAPGKLCERSTGPAPSCLHPARDRPAVLYARDDAIVRSAPGPDDQTVVVK
jgi:hypothetical protein